MRNGQRGFLLFSRSDTGSITPVAIIPAESPVAVARILGGDFLTTPARENAVSFPRLLFNPDPTDSIVSYHCGPLTLSFARGSAEFEKIMRTGYVIFLFQELPLVKEGLESSDV